VTATLSPKPKKKQKTLLTYSGESQLSTDHRCIHAVPAHITHRLPLFKPADLDTSDIRALASLQSHISIDTNNYIQKSFWITTILTVTEVATDMFVPGDPNSQWGGVWPLHQATLSGAQLEGFYC
jgi:hypothetical protein